MPRIAKFIRLSAACVVLTAASAFAQNVDGGPRLGFVNLNRILENWDVVKNFENQVNAKIEGTQAEIKTLGEQVNQLSEDLEQALLVYPPNSPQVLAIKDERRRVLAKLKSTRDFNLVYLQRQVNEKTLEFYNQAVKFIKDFGTSNNYDCILKISEDKIEAEDTGSLKLKISYRTVIFSAAESDITDQILAELNKK